MTFKTPEQAEAYLKNIADKTDGEINLGLTCLALAAPDHPDISLGRYTHYLKTLTDDLRAAMADIKDDSLEERAAVFQRVFVEKHGYNGDVDSYNDLQNADLIRVIDRRKGLPVALGILALHVMHDVGWEAYGLNFPGHFLLRLDKDSQRIIIDPFNECRVLGAPELRSLAKRILGEHAELSADYYNAATNRDILARLQNNLKLRQIESEDYEAALKTVEVMRKVDPGEYRLLLDEGVLRARLGYPQAAIDALEEYIEKNPDPGDRHDAALLVQQIRQQLN